MKHALYRVVCEPHPKFICTQVYSKGERKYNLGVGVEGGTPPETTSNESTVFTEFGV